MADPTPAQVAKMTPEQVAALYAPTPSPIDGPPAPPPAPLPGPGGLPAMTPEQVMAAMGPVPPEEKFVPQSHGGPEEAKARAETEAAPVGSKELKDAMIAVARAKDAGTESSDALSAPPAAIPRAPAQPGPVPGGPIAPQYALGMRGVGGMPRPPFDALDEHARSILSAEEQQREAISGAQSAQTANAVGTNEYTQQHAASLDDLLKIQDDFRTKAQAEVSDIAARNEALAKQANDAKIDPEHYWNTKSTGTKIAMALSMALGEFGSHMPHVSGGGQNLASQLIQSAIQRDVESQKDNIANKWKAVSEGTELVKNKIAEGNFVSDQLDKQKLLGEAKLRAQLTGLQAVTDSASKKAILAGETSASAERSAGVQDLMSNRRYSYSMSILAGQAAILRQQQKEYEEKYLYPTLIKNQEARAKGETESSVLPQGGVQGIRYYGQQAQNVPGAIPERDRAEANKELGLVEDAKSLAEMGKNVHSVSYDPRRYFQDTDAGKQKLVNDNYATALQLKVKQVAGLRMPEEERNAALSRLNSVIPEDGDNEARVRAKIAAAPHVIGTDITPILHKYGAAPPAPPPALKGDKVVQPAGK